jgi:Toxin PAAR-like domain
LTVTININDLSLSHKGDDGWVRSTLPDVCRSPTAPVPYVNVAYAKDLIKGTTTVSVDGGNMASVKGSEFYKSTGDEPGTGGGVISGVNLDKATWLSWSPNVFMEGRACCRLTDKMLLNRGNTVSVGGKWHHPISATHPELTELCDIACECIEMGDPHQTCVASKIKQRYPNAKPPDGESQSYWGEPVIKNSNGIQGLMGSRTGNNYLTTYWGVQGSLRPDVLVVQNGLPSELVEMKFPQEVPGEKDLLTYPETAAKLGLKYHLLLVAADCDCGDKKKKQPQEQPATEPQKQEENDHKFLGLSAGTWGWIGGGAVVVGGVACAILEPCGAAVVGGATAVGGALGLGGAGAAVLAPAL